MYILDNKTNFVIIVSVFIGLLIDLWKITKVVEVRLDTQNMIGGIIPRLSFIDRPSYVESSTREYDKVIVVSVCMFVCNLCMCVHWVMVIIVFA